MKVLITGAAGFVGTNLSDYLIKRGYAIVGIDLEDRHGRLKDSGLLENDNFTFRQLDLAKENINVSEFRDINIIFHFAALPHVDYSFFHPSRVVKNNIDSLLAIADLACMLGKPLILASSVEVYGGKEDRIYTEDDILTPLSPYAASKVASEAIVNTYVETKGLSATIFRFTNLYGQWQAPDRLLPRVIAQLIANKEITIEKGTNRDFVFIEDACKILEKAVHLNHMGAIFNLSSGIRRDNYAAVGQILDVLPTDAVNIIEPRTHDGRGKFLISSPEKLFSTTGWRATSSLEDGLSTTIEWYQSASDWLLQFEECIAADRKTDAFLTDSKLNISYWQEFYEQT